MKNSQNTDDPDLEIEPPPEDDALFGFRDESWFGELRLALRPRALGSLGEHELIAEVGRGGQGVVYRARQAGTGREIAIKRMVGGSLATDSARRRFEREVDVIQSLRHPGIVTLYGFEQAESGPLLLMEWIDGAIVTEWAAHHRRDAGGVRGILERFASLCDAVQYAHQNGVIHRDLKPRNVLVTPVGEIRVLDFGLAKVLDGTARDAEATRTGFLGTPAYAAPEQLDGRLDQMDARSDGYSLGVILYEMLTGELPYAADRGLRHLVDQIDRGALPAPSTRHGVLSREVFAIVQKALSARPEDRYPSVGMMATDVRHHLAGEPILARPPGSLEVLARLVRRHPVSAALATALLAAVVGFSIFVGRQSVEITTQRDRAEQEATTVQTVLEYVLDDLLMAANPVRSDGDPPVSEVLLRAAERVGPALAGQPEVERRVRALIGESLRHFGRIEEAEPHLARALDLARGLADPDVGVIGAAAFDYGVVLSSLGRTEEALAHLEEALAKLRSGLPRNGPVFLDALQALASLHSSRGDVSAAQALAHEGLDRLDDLDSADPGDADAATLRRFDIAFLLDKAGLDEQARRAYEDAIAGMKAHPERFRGDLGFVLTQFASVCLRLKDLSRAEDLLRDAIAIDRDVLGQDHPDVGEHMSKLANTLRGSGRGAEAEQLARDGLAIVRKCHREPSHVVVYAEFALARVLKEDIGDLVGAEAHFEAGLEVLESVYGPGHPAEEQVRQWLAEVREAQ